MSDWRDYSAMSREQLVERLRMAEDVCVYYGWSASLDRSRRGLACQELWMRWAALPDVDTDVASNADLAGAEADLAAARQRVRDATLRRIRNEGDGPAE